ncbi:hypothetical protein GCM10010315_59490 [Streptomyces luteosporeus]|uniref:Uncharacterized protein n=1 Tax=Streptomyces luteosporeus TaxID=173856 RepID=A0ABP6GM16_9ACTN
MVHHGPLARAARTAQLIGEHLEGAVVRADEAAGDYVPYFPGRQELPADSAGSYGMPWTPPRGAGWA